MTVGVAPLEVRVTTVYALSMPKYIYVQIRGVEKPAKIKADKIQREGDEYIISLANVEMGKFEKGSVQGWWIQEEEAGSSF